MALEQVPYTNFHDLNLDWVLKVAKEAQDKIDDEYADVTALAERAEAAAEDAEEQANRSLAASTLATQRSELAAESAANAEGYMQQAQTAYDNTLDLYSDLSGTISADTTAWLEENITQETGYVLDDSLTVQGAAADAKATGDAVNAARDLSNSNALAISLLQIADGAIKEMFADSFASNDPEATYAIGDYCTYISTLYRCIMPTTGGTFDSAAWTAVTVGDELMREALRVSAPTRGANISRVARYLDRYAKDGISRRLYTQSACYDGTYIYIVGSYNSDGAQNICRIDPSTGAIIDVATFTQLGHANDIALAGGYLWIADGSGAAIHRVDASTLAYVDSITASGYTAIYGVAEYNSVIYALANGCAILAYDGSVFTEISSFTRPANTDMQGGIVINNGFIYTLFNRSNEVYKIDLVTGDITSSFILPDGDGLRPCGECESLLMMNGRIYLLTAPSMSNTASALRYVSMAQIFDTDIDQLLEATNPRSYDSAGSPLTITCNANASVSVNPGTTVTTLEEACMLLNYAGSGSLVMSNVTEGYIFLHGGTYYVGSDGSNTVTIVDIFNANVITAQFYITNLYTRRSNVNLKANQHFVTIYTERSNLTFDRVHLSDLTTWTVYRSSFKFVMVRSVNSGITFNIPEVIGCNVEYKGMYLSGVLQLLSLAGNTGATGHRSFIRLYEDNAEPIGCAVNTTTVVQGTAITYALPYNSTYDNIKIENKNIYLDTNGTYAEASNTSMLEFFAVRNS